MSIRAWLVRNIVIRFFGWATRHSQGVEIQRRNMRWFGHLSPPPRSTHIQTLDCNGVPCEMVTAKTVADDAPIFVYFHGGGYSIGSPFTYRDFASQISRALGQRVLMPDYRLAPEHPYPAAIDDAYAAWRWVLTQGQTAGDTFIGGDSAGAGMSSILMMRLLQKREAQPAKAWLISPMVDLAMTGDSFKTHCHRDVELTTEGLRFWRDNFIHENDLSKYPELNACTESLKGWPPVCIQVGSEEVLLDDSRKLYANVKTHGVVCEYTEWAGMWHVFQPYGKFAPEPKRAFNEAMAFFKR